MKSDKRFCNIEDRLPDLSFLGKCTPKIRKFILQNADSELINAIRECLYNILKGNVHFNNKDLNKLKKYKGSIRSLVGKNCLKKNRRILVQKGGFLPIIIPTIVELIGSVIKSFTDRK